MRLIKNGKFFVPPTQAGEDFKESFQRLTAAGAGRQLGEDGFTAGPWTPELLAEAILLLDRQGAGVDLRTVQLWFQDNDKGISRANIRWLARIFGCDDPTATSEWQVELIAAQTRLMSQRRSRKTARCRLALPSTDQEDVPNLIAQPDLATGLTDHPKDQTIKERSRLTWKTEEFFSRGSNLNLPVLVFAGISLLGFLSYIAGIHNVTYTSPDGVIRQVGFLRTANWTLVFMIFLPFFVGRVAEILTFWKNEGRLKLISLVRDNGCTSLGAGVCLDSVWPVFLICGFFAGLIQWVGDCLLPLLKGSGMYVTDWSTIAVIRPDIVSVPEAIAFSGFAYLYMYLCFYLFFGGVILLLSIVRDLRRIGKMSNTEELACPEYDAIFSRIMRSVYRCTLLGILIATMMKFQSSYLTSSDEDILSWLIADLVSALNKTDTAYHPSGFHLWSHYSSLLIALSSCFVFLYGISGASIGRHRIGSLSVATVIVGLLFISYLSVDAFSGFSILLAAAVLCAVYGLLSPGFRSTTSGEV